MLLKTAAGPLFFGVIALLLFAGSYALWPEGFFSTPFSAMTASMLLRAVASPVVAIVGVEFLAALAIVLLADNQ
jgi:hypothetical protein